MMGLVFAAIGGLIARWFSDDDASPKLQGPTANAASGVGARVTSDANEPT